MTTAFSGEVGETDLCFAGGHPLEDVLGIVPEEIDAPTEGFENSFIYQGTEYPAFPPVWDRACEGRDGGILGLRQRFFTRVPGGDGA